MTTATEAHPAGKPRPAQKHGIMGHFSERAAPELTPYLPPEDLVGVLELVGDLLVIGIRALRWQAQVGQAAGTDLREEIRLDRQADHPTDGQLEEFLGRVRPRHQRHVAYA